MVMLIWIIFHNVAGYKLGIYQFKICNFLPNDMSRNKPMKYLHDLQRWLTIFKTTTNVNVKMKFDGKTFDKTCIISICDDAVDRSVTLSQLYQKEQQKSIN